MTELLVEQLRKIVLKTPEKIAIKTINSEFITFNELWDKACLVADYLKNSNIGINDNVTLIFTKSIDYIIAMIGVLINNSSFTPIDANQPLERINFIIEKVKPKLIITNKELISEFKIISLQNDILNLKKNSDIDRLESSFNNQKIKPDEILAYTIFTSGSTGQPKGVKISHSGLSSVINEQIELFGLNENSTTYFIYNISFDASLSDIWTSLISGATLFIDSDFIFKGEQELFNDFQKYNITHVDLPPSVFKFLNPANSPEMLETIILGGEAVDINNIHKWIKHGKNIISVYGPTEATICTSMEKCSLDWDKPYIGKPISTVNYDVDIYEDNIGELLISGDCLSLGYFENDKLNSEKFFYKNGIRYYKTGDLVKLHSQKIEFLGRIDRQIKYQGHLICPEEIESKLNVYTGVKNSVIVLDNNFLKCFIESDYLNKSEQIEIYLKQFFSKVMIPTQYFFLKNFPLLSNGKIDLKKINQRSSNNDFKQVVDTDLILGKAFKKVLDIKEIDPNISFFDYGGNSFLLISLIAECEKLGLKISAEDIYKYKNIKNISENLSNKSTNNTKELIKEVKKLINCFPENHHKNINFILDSKPENILLTGATGFLGSRILINLLKYTQAKIYCLVRDIKKLNDHESIELYLLNKDRIKVIQGNIELEKFNLSAETFNQLQNEIDFIYHIAADINHFKSYQELANTNVKSILTILDLMSKGKNKSLFYASTLSVFVDAEPLPKVCFENDNLENTKTVHGGYAQTKWVTEKLLQSAKEYGNISIFRLGLLTEDNSNGFKTNFDWFNSFIKGLSEIQIIPEMDFDSLLFDFTPVNYAAEMMTLSSLNIKHPVNTFHVTSQASFSFGDLINALKESRIDIKIVSNIEWLDYMKDIELSEFGQIAFIALKNNNSHLRIFKTSNTSFDRTELLKIVEQYKFTTPEINQNTLNTYVKHLLGNNL